MEKNNNLKLLKLYFFNILKEFFVYGWPIAVNGISYFLMWHGFIDGFQAFLIPGISLALALFLSHYKKGKGLCIVIALIYCFIKIRWLVTQTMDSMAEQHHLIEILIYSWKFYVVLLAYMLLVFIAARHLWLNKQYRKIFQFNKISYCQNLKESPFSASVISTIRGFNKLIGTPCLLITRLLLRHKTKILPFWFIPVMYFLWYNHYQLLIPNQPHFHFADYLQVWAIPLGVVLISFLAYKPFSLINKFGVMLSLLSPIIAGVYGLYQYGLYYQKFVSIILKKKPFLNTIHQVKLLMSDLYSWVWVLDLASFIIGIHILLRLWHSISKVEINNSFSKGSDNYGTSKFLSKTGINKINHPEGLIIGAMPEVLGSNDVQEVIHSIKKNGGRELIRIKTSHTTLVAPSRTGKGVGVVIPVLLEYQGPVFVTDVKGENYPIVKRARALRNRDVIAFDPFEITDSPKIKINPLKFLNAESIEVVDDAQTLANLICPISPRDGTNSHHFQSQAAAAIQCLLLYVVCSKTVDEKNKNLSYVYDLLCSPLEDLNELLTRIGLDPTIAFGSAARLANSIIGAHPEERSGILSSARVELRFIDTYQVREATSDSDFLLSDITKGNTDLFVCIPLEKLSTQHRLLRLLTGIIFIEMQKARGKIGKDNLLMVLDEMPALGHMKQIEEMLVFGGGFGISLLVVSQTIEFLQSVYPHTWKTFFSNQLSIFFGCSDPMTSKFVAEKLGKKTITINSVNESFGNQKRGMELSKTVSLQSSQSASETGRELLMADEIERLGERVVLAFDRGEFPIICHRIDYRERPEWRALWDQNPLHMNRENHDSISMVEYLKRAIEVLIN